MPSNASVAANLVIIPSFAATNALQRVCCCKLGVHRTPQCLQRATESSEPFPGYRDFHARCRAGLPAVRRVPAPASFGRSGRMASRKAPTLELSTPFRKSGDVPRAPKRAALRRGSLVSRGGCLVRPTGASSLTPGAVPGGPWTGPFLFPWFQGVRPQPGVPGCGLTLARR